MPSASITVDCICCSKNVDRFGLSYIQGSFWFFTSLSNLANQKEETIAKLKKKKS